MFNSDVRISNMLNVDCQKTDKECGFDKWYIELLSKRIKELDENDVYRMLRQEILIEVAVYKAIEIIKHNPLAGEMYDGQFLELLYSMDTSKYKNCIPQVKDILKEIRENISAFEWMCEDDAKAYSVVVEKFINKLEMD